MTSILRLSVALLAALIASPAPAAIIDPLAEPVSPREAGADEQSLGEIVRLLQTGRRDEAKEMLAAFLIARAHHPLALEIQGTLALEENRLEAAEESLRRALAAYPDSATIAAKLGAVLVRRGDIRGGRILLQKATKSDPSLPYAALQLARLEAAAGNRGAAIAQYRRLIDRLPGDGQALTPFHLELADVYNAARQYREARALLAGRIGDDLPQEARIAALRAAAQAGLGLKDAESAEREVQRLAALVPSNDRGFAVLAARLDALKGDVEAGANRLRAAQSGSTDPALTFAVARLYADNGKPREAAAVLQAAVNAMPRDADPTAAIRELATVLVEGGEAALAERTIAVYAARHSDLPRLAVMAASMEAARGDQLGALARLEQIERRAPELAELHDLRAQILNGMGRPQAALGSIRRAAQLDSRNIDYWMSYSAIAHAVGGHKLMAEALAEGLAANPGNPDLLFDLALADDEEGRTDEANRKYRQILDTDPQHVVTLVALARNLSVAPGGADEAKRLIAAALQLRPDDPEIKAGYALILHRGGDSRAALAILESLVRAAPRDAMLQYRLAVVYRASGEEVKALAVGRTALALGLGGAPAEELRAWVR
jgi:predicted Zn-dependent protease